MIKAKAPGDGEIVIAAGNNGLFAGVCRALEHSEWISDARFKDNPDRYANVTELYGLMEPLLASRPTAHWLPRLEAEGVPCAPVQNVAQVLEHPQFKAMQVLQPLPDSPLQVIGLPIRFDGTRPSGQSKPPAAGQHTAEILGPFLK